MRRLRDLALVICCAAPLVGWEPLWRNQPDLADGIEAYDAKKWDEALAAIDQATKEVPDAPELHIARGAALYQKAALVQANERFAPMTLARDEFQRSLGLDGESKKAAAWHNLATTITQLGMLQVRKEKDGPKPVDREERMNLLKTALDGFKKALERVPGDVDTKWNLEVAQRLLDQLEEEKKKEEEQKKKEQEKQDKKDKEQKKDQQKKDDQKQDQQKQDPQKQDQQKQDQQKQDQQKQDQQKQDQQKQDQQKQDQQKQDQQKQDQQKQDQQKKDAQKAEPQKPEQAKPAPRLDLAPLEALKNSEKPLQLYRIMMDPKKSRIKVRRDW